MIGHLECPLIGLRLSCWDRQRRGLGSMFGLLHLFLFWSRLHLAHQHGVLLLFSSQPQSSLSLRSVDFLLTSIFPSGVGTDIIVLPRPCEAPEALLSCTESRNIHRSCTLASCPANGMSSLSSLSLSLSEVTSVSVSSVPGSGAPLRDCLFYFPFDFHSKS